MQMEYNSLENLFRNEGLAHLSYKVIAFLDAETINAVIDFEKEQCNYQQSTLVKKKSRWSQQDSHILSMLQSFQLLKQYMNKTDRSMYYCYYQEPEFIQIQKSHLQTIVISQSRSVVKNAQFSTLYQQITAVFKHIKRSELLSPDQLDEIQRMFVDPSLPLPGIKRDKEGIYCNSSFQLYLVGLRFPHYADKPFNAFEQLQQRIESEEQLCFKDFFEIQKNKNVNKQLYQNLHLVRYMPYEITYENYDQLLIENNTAHNLIVLVFALTDVWVNSVYTYLSSITDPYYQFVELISRYAMFKSLIIQLEQSLGFVFHIYESLYADTIKDSIFSSANFKPLYCYWRPAMTKWFGKMKNMHGGTTDVYALLLTKLREEQIMEKISDADDTHNTSSTIIRKHAISLRNNLEMNSMLDDMKLQIQKNTLGESIIQKFICNNDELTCESLVFEYIEYVVDLSVNEETVHWCGHSHHRLGKAFTQFGEQFLGYNHKFYDNLAQNVLGDVQDNKTRAELLQQLVQNDVEFLEVKNVKPVILRHVVDKLNSNGSDNIQLQSNENSIPQLFKLITNLHTPIIHMQFTQKDQKLKYFNQKAKICQQIQGEVKYFFMIPPQLSPYQMLTKLINNNDNSEVDGSQEAEGYEYFSDDEEEMVEEGNEKGIKGNEKKENNQMECQDEQEIEKKDSNQNWNNNQTANQDEKQNQIIEDISQKLKVSHSSTAQSTKKGNSYEQSEKNQSISSHSIFKTNSF